MGQDAGVAPRVLRRLRPRPEPAARRVRWRAPRGRAHPGHALLFRHRPAAALRATALRPHREGQRVLQGRLAGGPPQGARDEGRHGDDEAPARRGGGEAVWEDWEDDDGPGGRCEGPRPCSRSRCGCGAEFARSCSWCGEDFALCLCCRDRTFICGRCFRNKQARGADHAKGLARRREAYRRLHGYRRRSRELRRDGEADRADLERAQGLLWTVAEPQEEIPF